MLSKDCLEWSYSKDRHFERAGRCTRHINVLDLIQGGPRGSVDSKTSIYVLQKVLRQDTRLSISKKENI